jgi:CRP-like cAMP-binding protein
MRNLLLERLESQRLPPGRLEPVSLRRFHPVEGEDRLAECVYFPVDCVVSLVKQMRDGRSVEIATIGNEGVTGAALVLRAPAPLGRMFVQVPGRALKLRASAFSEHLASHEEARALLERYVHALIAQIIQSSACNQLHSAAERCARWLLTMRDRRGSSSFALTHELMSQMLGVRRATVTEVAQRLKDQGAIVYRRGAVEIADEAALRRASCECYEAVAAVYEARLGFKTSA